MLYLYNTLSRSKEEFKPMSPGKINMFVCGQTVYDDAHLGHAKAYINFDIVARWLRHSGFKVHYIQTITDIDDKIIMRATEQGVKPIDLARKFEDRFMEDMAAIGVRQSVDQYPRSHDYIEVIRDQIQMLLDNGYAYIIDGDVYYDVSKFPDYTKLSGMKLDELENHRIEPKEGKRNPYDFALWKGAKEGEPSWDITVHVKKKETKLSGRPGWHIEDTAITYAIFGKQYDIHGGAIELIFPHHTNEIAQAEAAFGVKPFVRYWMHAGIMLIRGEKMSKSLKNFIRIRDLLKTYDAEALRLLVATTHYRKDVAYDDGLIKGAATRLKYLYSSFGIFYNMESDSTASGTKEVSAITDELRSSFTDAMNDDINTPLALTALASSIEKLRTYAESHSSIGKIARDNGIAEILSFAKVIGIFEKETYKEQLPEAASRLIKEREKLRSEKKFKEADAIREALKTDHHIIIEDSEYGTVWYKQ